MKLLPLAEMRRLEIEKQDLELGDYQDCCKASCALRVWLLQPEQKLLMGVYYWIRMLR